MQASISRECEPWNGPAQSITRSKPSKSDALAWSRSRTMTLQPPTSLLSASSAGWRRPARVNLTPGSFAASCASRDPKTPVAPTISTRSARLLDIVEQHLLVEQLAEPGMLDDQLEE